MRMVFGAVVAAAAIAASPAHAVDRAWSPLPATGVPVGTELRLRTLTLEASTPAIDINATDSQLRKGFGGSMVDFFPMKAEGFHLSAGSRMTSRGAYINTSQDERLAELLPSGGRFGYRASRKLTPALTAGYSREVSKDLTFGLEAGAMKGHFDSGYYSVVHPSRLGLGRDSGGSMNQVARMTAAFRF